MKLAIKQPSESMPNVLNDEEEEEEEEELTEAELQELPDMDNEENMDDDGVPMTIPADVSCVVPGCGRRHGRMCTFPVDGEMRTAWTSVLEAVFPTLDVNAPEPKLKLLCEMTSGAIRVAIAVLYAGVDPEEGDAPHLHSIQKTPPPHGEDHFEPADFDERGLIQPTAVPTLFPGGVKVIYNSSSDAGDEAAELEPEPEPEPEPITCCVPGCPTVGPPDSMFPFPEENHRAWTSIISAATNKNSWRKGEVDPISKRPLTLRVCKEHFIEEDFTGPPDNQLKPVAHPSLFDGGKKKVILRPSANTQSLPKTKPKTPMTRKPYAPRAKSDPGKKMGPVYVNVTDDGLQLLHKNGASVLLKDLTLPELRRIRDCLHDKLKTEVSENERKNLNLCVTQVTPVLEKMELTEAQNPDSSPVMADVMALNPDLSDIDVKRLVDNIRQVDCARRDYERSLSRFFEDSDNFARESEGLNGKINGLKRKISSLETTFLRFFKYNDQRRALMGAPVVNWAVPTLTIARDIIQKVGKTAYGRLLRMGFPLPSAAIVATSMERAHTQNVQWGLVDVAEERGAGDAQPLQNGANEDDGPPAKKAKMDGAAASGDCGSLQGITAEHLQDVLAGKGTLQDSQGRVIKVSLAEVPGAPPGAKTVVMETPDDAGEVRYVPFDSAAEIHTEPEVQTETEVEAVVGAEVEAGVEEEVAADDDDDDDDDEDEVEADAEAMAEAEEDDEDDDDED